MATARTVRLAAASGARLYGGYWPPGSIALSGDAALGSVSAGGSLADAGPSGLSGGATLDTVALSGALADAGPSALSGAATLDAVSAAGSLYTAGASSGDLPANTISTGSTASIGVTYGQPFKAGAVGAGASLSGRQLNALTYWPDGSVKHGIVSRIVSGSTSYTETLAIGTAASGATLATTDLPSGIRMTGVSITAGAFGSVSWTGTDWDSPFSTWFTGPVCSSWVYRKPLPSDSHLTAWLEVRLWSNGQVEVFPWIENGYLTIAGPTNKSATYTFSMGGTTRFSRLIDIKHHTRVPLLHTTGGEGSASTFSHWLGSDPAPRVAHEGPYLRETKLIPNLGAWGAPLSATLNALDQAYTPNTLAGDTNATGDPGGAGNIIAPPSAYYVSSGGDVRAWRAMLAHGLSSGSWSLHYRDDSTNLPFKFSDWPQIRLTETDPTQSVPLIPVGSGGQVSGTGSSNGPTMTHAPSYAYFPFLVTARWWFLEELHFWATYAYGRLNRVDRGGAAGVHGSNQTRGRAWGMNALAQAATITPTTHSLQSQFVSSWQSNTAHHVARYVNGTTDSGTWVSSQGFLGAYSADNNSSYAVSDTVSPRPMWYDAAWMHNFQVAVIGYTSDIGIPQSAQSLADHLAVRNHAYKQQIARAGGADGTNGYNWRRFIVYSYPFGADATGLPVETYYTPAQSYTEMMTGFGLSGSLPATWGQTLKRTASITVGEDDLGATPNPSHDYGSSGVAALALAVEHGVSGALTAWERVSSASNFASGFSSFMTDIRPEWSVLPRNRGVPSWMTTTNEWGVIPSSGGYFATNAGRYAWSGAVLNTVGVYKAGAFTSGTFVIAHGGGHTDSSSNAVDAFGPLESAAPEWFNVRAATSPAPINVARDGSSNPVSVHTYDGLVFDKLRNEMVRVPASGVYNVGDSRTAADVFRFNVDPAGQPWYSADTGLPDNGNFTAANVMAEIDPEDGTVYALGAYVPTWIAKKSSGATSWTNYAINGGSGGAGGAAFYPSAKLFVYITTAGQVRAHDMRGTPGEYFTPTVTGSGPGALEWNPALVWDQRGGRFIAWPNGGKTIFYLTPGANPYAGGNSWSWSSFTPSGGVTPPSTEAVADGGTGAHKYFSKFAIWETEQFAALVAEWGSIYYMRIR